MIRPGKKRSAYKARERDWAFMGWVKQQPCLVSVLPPNLDRITPCGGPIEADHLGDRAVGRKADDRTCGPMCRQHHVERTTGWGAFRNLVKAELREWRSKALEIVALAWAASSPNAEGPL